MSETKTLLEQMNENYMQNYLREQFCIQYAKMENCTPEEVQKELDRKDRTFLKLFEVFKMGWSFNRI